MHQIGYLYSTRTTHSAVITGQAMPGSVTGKDLVFETGPIIAIVRAGEFSI